MITIPYRTICIAAIIFSSFIINAQEETSKENWAQWMGPLRDGTWNLKEQFDHLDEKNLEKKWKVAIGSGYCGPTLADGKVYVMDYSGDEIKYENIHCFDAESGELIWNFKYLCEYAVGYPTGPRASVIIQDNKAYALGTMGNLHCLNASNGELIWSIDGNKQYKIDMPIWGIASSPIIEDQLIIVQMGGSDNSCIVAFNKESGHEVWRALSDMASYSSPIIINQANKRVLIYWTGDNVLGMNPTNGDVYWKIPFERKKLVINISTPEYEAPYLFLSSFYDGSMLIELDQEKPTAKLLWERMGESERKTDALHCIMSTPFIQGDFIYGVDSYGEFRCLDLYTGDRIWTDSTLTPYGRWSNAHFAFQNDKFWAFNEKGQLVLGKVSPERFSDLGRVELIKPVRISPNPRGGVNWAYPAFAGNKIIARSDAFLVCYELKK